MTTPTEYEEVYIVFDGPPTPTGPKFVEVETTTGQSVTVAWEPDRLERKGYFRLGPFYIEKS